MGPEYRPDLTPFPGEILYQDTMRRIQRMEEVTSNFNAVLMSHTSTEEMKFEALSNQISKLGQDLGDAIGELGRRVDKLDKKTEENADQLEAVLELHATEKEAAANRKRWFWRIVAVVGIPLTGLLTRFGEVAWDYWFSKK